MLEGEKKKQEKEKKKKKEEFIAKLSSLKLWSTQKKFWLPAYGLWKSKLEIELLTKYKQVPLEARKHQ